MNLLIPLFYHPITISLIDDNQDYLDNLMLKLSGEFLCKTFSDAEKAASEIFQSKNKTSLLVRSVDVGEVDEIKTSFDLRSLYSCVYDNSRFQYPGLVVVDYEMPRLNGLDFCERLPRSIKRILLTGVADQNTAIEAFNKNIIDAYISKGKQSVAKDLSERLREVELSCFIEVSDKVLMQESSNKLRALFDKNFSSYFYDLLKKHRIKEFYITDSYGGFLLIDANAKPSWLAVKSKADLDDFYDLAKMAEDVSEQILEDLQTGKRIPYFFNDSDLDTPPGEWESFMFDANQVAGESEVFFSSFISDYPGHGVRTAEILSFNQALSDVG